MWNRWLVSAPCSHTRIQRGVEGGSRVPPCTAPHSSALCLQGTPRRGSGNSLEATGSALCMGMVTVL